MISCRLVVSLKTWGLGLAWLLSILKKTSSLVLQVLGSRLWLVDWTLSWKWLLGFKGARISFRVILFQNLIVSVFRHLIKTSSHSFDRSIIFVWILSWQWLLGILLSASFCDSGIVSIVRNLKKKNAHVPLINRFKSECELKQVSINKFGLRLIAFQTERTCCIISPEKIPLAPIAFALCNKNIFGLLQYFLNLKTWSCVSPLPCTCCASHLWTP